MLIICCTKPPFWALWCDLHVLRCCFREFYERLMAFENHGLCFKMIKKRFSDYDQILRHIFPRRRFHLRIMSCWKYSKVPTATLLIWSLYKENLNNVLSSSPWSLPHPPIPHLFVLAAIRNHLSRQLTETKADYCSLRSGSVACRPRWHVQLKNADE